MRLIESSTWSGSGLPPCLSITSAPASWTSQSNATPVASRTRRVASLSSGPVPSPGINVTSCATAGTLAGDTLPASWPTSPPRSRLRCRESSSPRPPFARSIRSREYCATAATTSPISPGMRPTRRSPTCCSRASYPAADELAGFKEELAQRELPANVQTLIDGNAHDVTPMEMLRTATSLLSFADPAEAAIDRENEPPQGRRTDRTAPHGRGSSPPPAAGSRPGRAGCFSLVRGELPDHAPRREPVGARGACLRHRDDPPRRARAERVHVRGARGGRDGL